MHRRDFRRCRRRGDPNRDQEHPWNHAPETIRRGRLGQAGIFDPQHLPVSRGTLASLRERHISCFTAAGMGGD